MLRTIVLILGCAVFLAACRGSEDGTPEPTTTSGPGGVIGPIEIRTELNVAAEEGADTIATGDVLAGSTLGGSPFCVGGTILDVHADPVEEPDALIERTITCQDGTLTLGLTPEVGAPGDPQDLTQAGSWTFISGTDAFEGLSGSGKMETRYGANEAAPVHETLTGKLTAVIT